MSVACSFLGRPIMFVFVCGRNTEEYVRTCLHSVIKALKNVKAGRLVFLDDASDDDSALVAKSILEKSGVEFEIIVSKARQGRVGLFQEALPLCNSADVIVSIDGDDSLVAEDALSLIEKKYDSGAWCTWGRDTSFSYPPNDFRMSRTRKFFEHPWSCYAGLLKSVRREDLLYEGRYADVCTDRFLFYPPFEMAAERLFCVNKVIYRYNLNLPTNVRRVDPERQLAALKYINQRKPYGRIPVLP